MTHRVGISAPRVGPRLTRGSPCKPLYISMKTNNVESPTTMTVDHLSRAPMTIVRGYGFCQVCCSLLGRGLRLLRHKVCGTSSLSWSNTRNSLGRPRVLTVPAVVDHTTDRVSPMGFSHES